MVLEIFRHVADFEGFVGMPPVSLPMTIMESDPETPGIGHGA